jgi:hypothetical protein
MLRAEALRVATPKRGHSGDELRLQRARNASSQWVGETWIQVWAQYIGYCNNVGLGNILPVLSEQPQQTQA